LNLKTFLPIRSETS